MEKQFVYVGLNNPTQFKFEDCKRVGVVHRTLFLDRTR